MPSETSQSKRLVVLTRSAPEHCYVTNTLCSDFDVAAVLVDTREASPNWRRARRKGLGHFGAKAARAGFLRLVSAQQRSRAALLEVLHEGREPALLRSDLVYEVDGINSAAAAARIDEIAPDALLVYGTSIVRDSILQRALDLAFNMHTGISPYYRGTSCAFWPIVEGEPEMLGATVHECTSAVDGGRIFATGRARIEAGDGVYHAFARAVEVGAELYSGVVRRYLDGTLQGELQDLSVGREYRGEHLTLSAELRARRAVRRGLLRDYAARNRSTAR